MSLLVRDVYPTVQAVIFDPTKIRSGQASGGTSADFPAGTLFYDASTNTFQTITASGTTGLTQSPSVQGFASAVTNTNATSATALMTYKFQAGQLNILAKTIQVYAAGEYTTDSGTGRTMTVAVTLYDGTNTETLATWTSGATTASKTGFAWNLDLTAMTSTAGTSGKTISHGVFNVLLGATNGAAITSYADQIAGENSTTLDLTKALTLSITQLYSGSNAANTFTEDMLVVSILN